MKQSAFQVLFSLLIMVMTAEGTSDLQCTSDGNKMVNCIWHTNRSSSEAFCDLTTGSDPKTTCKLKKMYNSSAMKCSLTANVFPDFKMEIVASCKENTSTVNVTELHGFYPMQQVQFLPPYNLMADVKIEAENTIISWTMHLDICGFGGKVYEIRYKPKKDSWESSNSLTLTNEQTWVKIEKNDQVANETYEAQVRIKPSGLKYCNGIWSEWSKPAEWTTNAEEVHTASISGLPENQNLNYYVYLLAPGALSVMMVLIFIRCCNSENLTIRHKKIPNPAKFFDPLISFHGGNFQKWLGTAFSEELYTMAGSITDMSDLHVFPSKEATNLSKKDPPMTQVTLETSGQSVSSFHNQGYFLFRYSNSVEVDPCQVYFTYDPFTSDSSSDYSGAYENLASPETIHSEVPSFSRDDETVTHSEGTNESNTERNPQNNSLSLTLHGLPASSEDMLNNSLQGFNKALENNDCSNENRESSLFAGFPPFFGMDTSRLNNSFGKKIETQVEHTDPEMTDESEKMTQITNCATSDPRHDTSNGSSAPSLITGYISADYLSFKEVQDKYSNHSI
ncbi:interleukin-2 receptor subunit beta [Protopterus annectens]|uniref:interleukin-2 receptor subunit beta n=1 Tax=Protopterus annectens TaxID=7888 RepID=UPI001CFA0860|nr:interleukin-2 receptor subunit beta [Protopterus annectens]